jgi:hypothetical protein
MEALLEGILTAHGVANTKPQSTAGRAPFRSPGATAQVRPPVTARAAHAARRGTTLTAQRNNKRRPASARRAAARPAAATARVPARPASACGSVSARSTASAASAASAATRSSTPLPAWAYPGKHVRARKRTPPTAGMMLEFAARRGMGEDVAMGECDGKPPARDRFDTAAAAQGPNGELRFREYTADEDEGAARVRAAAEAYCAQMDLGEEAAEAHIAKELGNYDNALGRRDVRKHIHDEVSPIENRREMTHVPGMHIYMGEAINADDAPFRFDRTSAALAPTPPTTPPSTPPGADGRAARIPTPEPDYPWALDRDPEPVKSGSRAVGASTATTKRPQPVAAAWAETSCTDSASEAGSPSPPPSTRRPSSAPVKQQQGRAMHSVHPLQSPSAATAAFAAKATARDGGVSAKQLSRRPTPPLPQKAGTLSARPLSARASVQQAKQVVGKATWQRLDKSERGKLAAEVAKWTSSPRSAAKNHAVPSDRSAQGSSPGTPVGVKIGRTVEQLKNMRLHRRKQPRTTIPGGMMGMRTGSGSQAVTMHGAAREPRSHTPPQTPNGAMRLAEVW